MYDPRGKKRKENSNTKVGENENEQNPEDCKKAGSFESNVNRKGKGEGRGGGVSEDECADEDSHAQPNAERWEDKTARTLLFASEA